MDFTLNTLERLLKSLDNSGYHFFSVREFLENRASPAREADHFEA